MNHFCIRPAFGLWLIAVALGFLFLGSYQFRPGSVNPPPPIEPRDASRPWRMVIGVHPRCPCTRASLVELERLLRFVGDQVECQILVVTSSRAQELPSTDIVHMARRIRGVAVLADNSGSRCRDLGILTSGGCLLYDASGQCWFSGGLTAGRAHEGDSPGSLALRRIVEGSVETPFQCPTFGCPLHNDLTREVPSS